MRRIFLYFFFIAIPLIFSNLCSMEHNNKKRRREGGLTTESIPEKWPKLTDVSSKSLVRHCALINYNSNHNNKVLSDSFAENSADKCRKERNDDDEFELISKDDSIFLVKYALLKYSSVLKMIVTNGGLESNENKIYLNNCYANDLVYIINILTLKKLSEDKCKVIDRIAKKYKFSPRDVSILKSNRIYNRNVEMISIISEMYKLTAEDSFELRRAISDEDKKEIINYIGSKYHITPEDIYLDFSGWQDYLAIELGAYDCFAPFINPQVGSCGCMDCIQKRIKRSLQNFQPCLAKYYYLLYEGARFILPELDYNFSIRELIYFNRIPQIIRFGDGHISLLNLAGMRIKSLDGLECLDAKEEITYLNLANNQICELPTHCFEGFASLTYLSLAQNSIMELPKHMPKSLSNLISLKLFDNAIQEIPEHCFDNLINLENLELSKNYITAVSKGCFDNLEKLKQLNLSNCQTRYNPNFAFNWRRDLLVGIFDDMKRKFENSRSVLEGLCQKHVKALAQNNNDSSTRLSEDDLFGSQIQELPEDCFDEFGHLNYSVYYTGPRRNRIKTLPAGCFRKNKRLRVLILGDNQIRELPHNCFDNLKQLRWLGISYNKLKTLPNCLGMNQLRGINLSHNELTELPENCFKDSEKLLWLDLTHNDLRKYPGKRIENLDKFYW